MADIATIVRLVLDEPGLPFPEISRKLRVLDRNTMDLHRTMTQLAVLGILVEEDIDGVWYGRWYVRGDEPARKTVRKKGLTTARGRGK